MLSTRHLSPQQLSLLTAAILSTPISLAILVFEPLWWIAPLSFIIIFAGSYGLILFTLQTFIYRKIKLIYKLIYQTKATKREEFYYKNILPQKGIDEVREDVEAWAEQRKKEIETLQQNETFRKEFLQNLSHELKTPIFAIQGYVHTLLDGALHNNEVNEKYNIIWRLHLKWFGNLNLVKKGIKNKPAYRQEVQIRDDIVILHT